MKIKDIKENEKREALLARAKSVSLTEEATEIEVVEAEGKAAKGSAQSVTVGEQDIKTALHEIRNRLKDSTISDEKLKEMITEVVKKQSEEAKSKNKELVRKGEFDIEEESDRSSSRRKMSSRKLRFKNFVVGNAPRSITKRFEEDLKTIQDMNDQILICAKALSVHPKDLEMYEEYEKAAKDFASKAMVSTTASSGDEFVPTNFSAQIIDRVRLELKVAALHDRMPMLSNPYTLPLEGSDSTAYLTAESSVEATEAGRITASTPGSKNVTFTAKKLAARSVFSEEINEDSIIAIFPYVRGKIVLAMANAIEDCTINGDDSGTHQDADVTSSADARKAWKGYRKLAVSGAKRDAGGDALDAADMRVARKKMGKYGVNPKDLAWVVGVATYSQMLSEDDASGFNDFRTLEKYGPNAVVLNGVMGFFDGIPVIVSEFVRETLNASGVYDSTTHTTSSIMLVNRSRFMYGDRKAITVKSYEDIQTDQMVLVTKQRLDFQPVEDSTNTMIGLVYNILS